jgi:Flp pilus assembly protein TadD
MRNKLRNSGLIAASLLLLATLPACSPSKNAFFGKAIDGAMGQRAETEERLSTAATRAIAAGKSEEALMFYENLYERNRRDPDIALNYAQLLRKTGNAESAADILGPFVKAKRKRNPTLQITPILLNEYAASLIETGKLEKAEAILDRVLSDELANGAHADAYNLMGIVLDAEGEHKEAEEMFRLSLEGWRGDSTSVMNNLAICLANQGLFKESLKTLHQALIMAPEKKRDIARNIRLVNDMRSTADPIRPTRKKLPA